ncbi:hypothetical protein BACEGG_01830 [Bacteroides eggerthii DSM 20697]|nr:hypothetical protein BACEGG_01830 [Bacteroides eggerthii DSM 20697]
MSSVKFFAIFAIIIISYKTRRYIKNRIRYHTFDAPPRKGRKKTLVPFFP